MVCLPNFMMISAYILWSALKHRYSRLHGRFTSAPLCVLGHWQKGDLIRLHWPPDLKQRNRYSQTVVLSEVLRFSGGRQRRLKRSPGRLVSKDQIVKSMNLAEIDRYRSVASLSSTSQWRVAQAVMSTKKMALKLGTR